MRKAKWIALVLLLTAAGATVWRLTEDHEKPVPFPSLSQPDRQLAIYDTFVAQLRQNYFDSKLLKTDQWSARFKDFRGKAAAAPDDSHLYADVLQPLAHSFPDSHVEAIQPIFLPTKGSPPATRSGNPGFTLAVVRRAKAFRAMVGDVDRNSPAERAGIAPGYVIENFSVVGTEKHAHLKGEFFRSLPDEVRSFERDFKWTTPTSQDDPATEEAQLKKLLAERRLVVEYDYEPPLVTPPFESRTLANGVTYVRFDNYNDTALIDRVLALIDRAPPNGLIVDLRKNGGGLTAEMHRVLNRLLGHDAYIGTHRHGSWFEDVRTDKEGPVYTGPLVLLIGPQSSSGAEITAAAVLDNKRGLLIGRMTSGSVMESNYFPLPDGGQVQIPVNDYVRGGDRRIESVGIAPDIWILPTLDDVRAGRDPVLDRALKEISG